MGPPELGFESLSLGHGLYPGKGHLVFSVAVFHNDTGSQLPEVPDDAEAQPSTAAFGAWTNF